MAIIEASLDSGSVDLTIDTAKNTVAILNEDTRDALFNVFNAAPLNGQQAGSVVVWNYRQNAGTQGTIPIPTADYSGKAITWQVGQVTEKGVTTTGIINPPWQLTMI